MSTPGVGASGREPGQMKRNFGLILDENSLKSFFRAGTKNRNWGILGPGTKFPNFDFVFFQKLLFLDRKLHSPRNSEAYRYFVSGGFSLTPPPPSTPSPFAASNPPSPYIHRIISSKENIEKREGQNPSVGYI